MRYAEHVADLIGHTPLVRLNHVVPTGPDAPLVLAKVEYFNPGGSVKDRIAERMIDAAEASGELKPGGTIVEPTSGNTGIGLAIVAQQRGYHCIFVVPDKVSVAKQDALRAYGAEVVVCPAAVEPEQPGVVLLGLRPARPRDRRRLEAQPVRQPGQPGVARRDRPARRSGSRPTGASRTSSPASAPAARSRAPATTSRTSPTAACRSSAPTPIGSVYSGGDGPALPRRGRRRGLLADDLRPRRPRRDRRGARPRLLPHDATPGPRGGAAGRRLVRDGRRARPRRSPPRPAPTTSIVVLLPDGGRGYLSTVFNDGWMSSYGFLTPDTTEWTRRRRAAPQGRLDPGPRARHPNETVADAVSIMREFGVSQMPIVRPSRRSWRPRCAAR